uniref:Transmembrane protein n=1 Tax=Globodera pallida TaxID=36090 RepID=A0A183BK34_GLOPA
MGSCVGVELEQYKSNLLERRLGIVMVLCMAVLLTVLVINGLFHDRVRATTTEFIGAIEREVRLLQQNEIVLFSDDTFPTTPPAKEVAEGEEILLAQPNLTSAVDGEKEETVSETNNNGNLSLTERLLQLRMRANELTELDEFRQRFADTDVTIWTLVLLNLLGLIVMVPSTCRFWLQNYGAQTILLVLLVLLLLVQLVLLLSLLDNASNFPPIVDKLFDTYLTEVSEDKIGHLIEPIEDQFSCKIRVEHELLERYGLQEKCVPKMKDRLLAPYIVSFLILVTIFPFILTIFTCLWPKNIQILAPIEKAHRKVQFFPDEER